MVNTKEKVSVERGGGQVCVSLYCPTLRYFHHGPKMDGYWTWEPWFAAWVGGATYVATGGGFHTTGYIIISVALLFRGWYVLWGRPTTVSHQDVQRPDRIDKDKGSTSSSGRVLSLGKVPQWLWHKGCTQFLCEDNGSGFDFWGAFSSRCRLWRSFLRW